MDNITFKTLSPQTQTPKTLPHPLKIAVAGTGYVGLVSGVCMAHRGHYVTCGDIDVNKVTMMQQGISPIYEQDLEELMYLNKDRLTYTTDYKSAYKNADVIFIGVGTPEQPDGSANLSYIATVAKQIAETVEKDCLVVVKSTVPVGTNDKVEQFIQDFLVNDVNVQVASNPEFLAQGTAVRDTLEAARIIIGTNSIKAEDTLMAIYEPFGLPIVSVSRRSAEMIKYAANDFLALKISYMNDIANLCELVGADIEDVARGMGYDSRIGSRFLNAGIGYGGSCFPKDTKALNYLATLHGYELRTVKAAIDVNDDQKVLLYKKACQRLITFNGLKVAVLGLTFKPGTDDLREAPSLDNIPLLLAQGAEIYAYDPVGSENFRRRFPQISSEREGEYGKGNIYYVRSAEAALENANVCFIFTEWGEIKAVMPEDYKKLMRTPLVYDGRNIYDVNEMRESGVEYYSIGRK
ncbi:UDP-glucose dehydrogenase family protein [Desulfosporosinus shakirovi]|uniref:UDP-glucose dehydrogenase family protein n=1 Tax=Desulfosporosinus shakirovi TaxID=2885154 RepID=UPI00249ECDC3|nr:UDP-glucose/GDP-mannose dehydrogenase family protein [Desulfosporosinus sp. SRJS8]MCB8817595.1 UDP-glucose/GDP-mannose dehydrogenase family protein [Desulfosporosinus sp. SRJS8]